MRLKNKIALVTGGSRGIGRSIAILFAKEGANVALTYLSHKKEADSVVNEIKKLDRKAIAIKCDVADSFEDVVKKVVSEFQRVDILVNNAGLLIAKPFKELSEEVWDNTINVNLKGVYNCIKAVAPQMVKQKRGKIINISSIAGIVGSMANAAYASAKAGVDAMTKTLAREFGNDGITVNSVAPGPVRTDMLLGVYNKQVIEELASEIPIGRIGEPEDIAKVVLFFASDDSDYVNGQTLIVDGGRVVK